MQNPLVTVIVVSYNHSKYIVENLNSIKNQTYKNIQLILVDDASTDDSVEVYNDWVEQNNYSVTKVFNSNNIGLASSLNNCFKLIEGKYVKIIAADDYLHPESIEKCASELERLGDEYGMVFTESCWVDDDSHTIEEKNKAKQAKKYSPKEIKKTLFHNNFIMALTVLMSTEALIKTGFYNPDIIIEDYDRWLRINEKYLTAHLPIKLAYYRLHSTNITRIKKIQIEEEDLLLKLKYDKYGKGKKILNRIIIKKYLNQQITKRMVEIITNYPYTNHTIKALIVNEIKPNLFIKMVLKTAILFK